MSSDQTLWSQVTLDECTFRDSHLSEISANSVVMKQCDVQNMTLHNVTRGKPTGSSTGSEMTMIECSINGVEWSGVAEMSLRGFKT